MWKCARCFLALTAASIFRQVLVVGAFRNCDIPRLRSFVTRGIFQVFETTWPVRRLGYTMIVVVIQVTGICKFFVRWGLLINGHNKHRAVYWCQCVWSLCLGANGWFEGAEANFSTYLGLGNARCGTVQCATSRFLGCGAVQWLLKGTDWRVCVCLVAELLYCVLCARVCVCVCVCVYVFMCVYVCKCVCICVCMCVRMYYVCMYVCVLCMHVFIYVLCMCVRMHVCMYLVRMCMYLCT